MSDADRAGPDPGAEAPEPGAEPDVKLGVEPDARPGVEPDVDVAREPELADVVARLRRAMRRAWRAKDEGNPLSVAQLELLTSLQERPGSRPGQLARALRLAPNSVTTLVNGLQGRGLVTRAEGATDRRTVHLTLSAAGQEAVRRWQSTNADILRDAVAQLGAPSRDALTGLLPVLRELVETIDRATDGATDRNGG
ncbi:MAG TPA: MarR family transcriptional regulator [Cellulomonas sp.]